jgi:imidazolonepropionase-like amidohydrolase
MLRKVLLLTVAAIRFVCPGPAVAAGMQQGELYTGFTLVDPEAQVRTADSWIVVQGGRITAIGTGRPPAGDYDRHDMTGLYAMPGLVDAHGHLTGGPQRVAMVDGALRIEITTGDEFSRANGAIALAFGATSVRNPGGSADAAARYDAKIASGE